MNWRSEKCSGGFMPPGKPCRAKVVERRILACAAALLILFSAGCVRRITRTVFWGSPQSKAARAASVKVPRSRVREALERQAAGAFDPLIGDRRVGLLNARLRLDPQDAEARVELGQIYEQYSVDELALEQFTRALNLQPDNLPAVRGLARVAGHKAQWAAEAVPLARAFLSRHPKDVPAIGALGSLLDAAGDLAGAEAAYRSALGLEPSAAYLHNNLGFNLMLQNRMTEAVSEFRRALELDPHSMVTHNNLGIALAQSGRREAALKEFIAAGADRATAHNNLAAILLEQNLLEESRAELLQALSARSFFPEALENFKLVLERDRERHALPAAVPFRPAIPAGWLRPLPAPPAPEQGREPR